DAHDRIRPRRARAQLRPRRCARTEVTARGMTHRDDTLEVERVVACELTEVVDPGCDVGERHGPPAAARTDSTELEVPRRVPAPSEVRRDAVHEVALPALPPAAAVDQDDDRQRAFRVRR